MSLSSIILTAHKEKEMNSKLPAALLTAGGKPFIDWVIDSVTEAGSEKNIVAISEKSDKMREHLGDRVEYVCQTEQLGTAHALMQGIASLSSTDGSVIVIGGNTPLITAEVLKSAYGEHMSKNRSATVITADKEANSGIYIFDIQKLSSALPHISGDRAQSENCLRDICDILLSQGEAVGRYITEPEQVMEVKDRIQLAEADRLLNMRSVTALMKEGVSVLNPESVRIDSGVKVGRDTIIYPGTILEGDTEIGEDCVIGPNTRIVSCKIGCGTEVQSSVALNSQIGDNTSVGPFAYIRPNSKIGDNIKVGDFVEIKNASIGNDTKISHLTYVGDADVGERVNFGCGTVVVNYDGISKHRSVIEDDCFIGCNTNLVSPVTVRKGAYTAAGSTITNEVPADALAIARSRQVIKDGWAKGKKK